MKELWKLENVGRQYLLMNTCIQTNLNLQTHHKPCMAAETILRIKILKDFI